MAMGHKFEETFKHVEASCIRLGATEDEMDAVFRNTAKRLYKL